MQIELRLKNKIRSGSSSVERPGKREKLTKPKRNSESRLKEWLSSKVKSPKSLRQISLIFTASIKKVVKFALLVDTLLKFTMSLRKS